MKGRDPARIVFGLIVMIVGLVFLAQTLHLGAFGQLLSLFWPLLIVALGVLSLVRSPRQWIFPVVIILVGVVLEMQRLGIINYSFWSVFWPVLLILFGLSIITGHSPNHPVTSGDDQVDLFVGFSGTDVQNTSQHFQGGRLSALFGGIKLDLRHAQLATHAQLETTAMFGGVEIIVPEDWTVKVSGLPLFGGLDDKTTKPKPGGPVLDVHGTAIFGGVGLRNRPSN